MKNQTLLTIILLITLGCKSYVNENKKFKDSIPTTSKPGKKITIDSVSNWELESNYIINHIDDTHKPNRIINNYKDLLENSILIHLPSSIPDSIDYEENEFFLTEDFLKNLLNQKDELKFEASGTTEISGYCKSLPIKETKSAIEYAPIKKYSLSDSIFAFSFSSFNLPSELTPQFYYETYLLIFDSYGKYIGGFEAYYDASHGMSGYGNKIRTEILKSGDIQITFKDFSPDKFNNTITTDIETTFRVTDDKQIKRVSYNKKSKSSS
jgi:hypothetical protein